MVLGHVPEVHHDLAVFLPFIFAETLKPENVVGSHQLCCLAARRLLALLLGLGFAHCRDVQPT